jgi:hypothetical protein
MTLLNHHQQLPRLAAPRLPLAPPLPLPPAALPPLSPTNHVRPSSATSARMETVVAPTLDQNSNVMWKRHTASKARSTSARFRRWTTWSIFRVVSQISRDSRIYSREHRQGGHPIYQQMEEGWLSSLCTNWGARTSRWHQKEEGRRC